MEIKPVNAIIYNQEIVDMNDVTAPPYDVITNEQSDELYEKSPYNIVRLILTKGENRYADAKKYYDEWLSKKVLIKKEKPCIFYMVQKYVTDSGRKVERKGFIAKNKIEEFETKKILPHEYTMGAPKEDRLKLTRAIDANLSQVFMVYSDSSMRIENEVAPKYINQTPFMDITDEKNVNHKVWIIDDLADIQIIQDTLKDKTLLIADGHHRYETALNYSKESENEEAKFVMSYFTNSKDDNLIIFPTHRIITKDISSEYIMQAVKKYYNVIEMPFTIQNKKEVKAKFLESLNGCGIITGLYLKGKNSFYVLTLKEGAEDEIQMPDVLKKLDLVCLQELIITKELKYTKEEQMAQEGIKYIKQEFEAFDAIDNNKASASFIMAYPKMQDILDVSGAGYRMPQKSTYFYPKLLSGIAINPLS
ncbi:MAG: DUF1015 domain-containing protein [Candidatus Gastranaerophilales bacterium]|nr:DUF1015 domain-containing protein [Candidatus Gastranaerophilales bacterium]